MNTLRRNQTIWHPMISWKFTGSSVFQSSNGALNVQAQRSAKARMGMKYLLSLSFFSLVLYNRSTPIFPVKPAMKYTTRKTSCGIYWCASISFQLFNRSSSDPFIFKINVRIQNYANYLDKSIRNTFQIDWIF